MTNSVGYQRRFCSKCGEGLGFTEDDPCDKCAEPVEAPAEKIWLRAAPHRTAGWEIVEGYRRHTDIPYARVRPIEDYETVLLAALNFITNPGTKIVTAEYYKSDDRNVVLKALGEFAAQYNPARVREGEADAWREVAGRYHLHSPGHIYRFDECMAEPCPSARALLNRVRVPVGEVEKED